MARIKCSPLGRGRNPVERTLLTTGVDSYLMESAHQGHKRIETPMLKVALPRA